MVLLIREGFEALFSDVRTIREHLATFAVEHAETPMIGRTHHVHATPITFGLKAATWVDEIDSHVERLKSLEERLFVVQFFGATGTLASLGEDGLAVQAALADDLDLSVPETPWFAARDRFAELLQVLAVVSKTLSKIARQILLLNRSEIGELGEPIPAGEVGSSTMPHKQNPMRSETIIALATLVSVHAGVMTDLMEGYDERDYATWLVEFAILPETFLYASRITANAVTVLGNLDVNEESMAENPLLNGELVTSEAVMMRLGADVGRASAHEIVYENAMAAIEGEETFSAVLCPDKRVTAHLSDDEIDRFTAPESYIGVSSRIIDSLLSSDDEV
jgi:3-carboxy-cis,cis-muconate cycloisomerase